MGRWIRFALGKYKWRGLRGGSDDALGAGWLSPCRSLGLRRGLAGGRGADVTVSVGCYPACPGAPCPSCAGTSPARSRPAHPSGHPPRSTAAARLCLAGRRGNPGRLVLGFPSRQQPAASPTHPHSLSTCSEPAPISWARGDPAGLGLPCRVAGALGAPQTRTWPCSKGGRRRARRSLPRTRSWLTRHIQLFCGQSWLPALSSRPAWGWLSAAPGLAKLGGVASPLPRYLQRCCPFPGCVLTCARRQRLRHGREVWGWPAQPLG